MRAAACAVFVRGEPALHVEVPLARLRRHRVAVLGDRVRARRPPRAPTMQHRARPLLGLEVQAAGAGVVGEVGREEHDRPAGLQEVEEDARVVGDQDVGRAEHQVGRDLVGHEHPLQLRAVRGQRVHALVRLQQHGVAAGVDPLLDLRDVREQLIQVVFRAAEGLALPGRRVEDDLAVAERDARPDQPLPHALAAARRRGTAGRCAGSPPRPACRGRRR